MSKIFTFDFTVTEDLLDDYGHVNNAKYLELYEEARWAVLELSNLGVDAVRRLKTGPVILEVTVSYRRELTPGKSISIETSSRREGSRKFYFDQVMKDTAGNEYSTAVFTAALFDLEKRKMIIPDEKWLKAFGF